MNIVILAAGQGKRMRSDLPKVLQALAGKPLLSHVIATARALKPAMICIVYGHGGEQVRERLAAPGLTWVKQEQQLGTGHAVLQALPHLDPTQPTLVLYGDVPLTRIDTLLHLIDKARAQGDCALALLTAYLDDPRGYGRIVRAPVTVGEEGAVLRIVEDKDAAPEERAIRETNTGILFAPTEALRRWLPGLGNQNAQGEYYLTDIVGLAVRDKLAICSAQPLDAWETEGVNSPAQLAALERIYQRNVAGHLMEQGVRLADPTRIDVRGELLCGRDVFIDANCLFEGRVELGDRVEIGPNCVLKDAKVGSGTRIAAFSHIDSATLGRDNAIGPYARLRPGAMLGDDVHIGNFVEVKNSTIADHSKANHLAYVGDATVGSRVNIGAGTITCNYDGGNKHRTIIEDDVFIGSDTQLVAPVTVRRGATLGAGTTLTKDAEADTLTISRVRQITIAGWKRPVKARKD